MSLDPHEEPAAIQDAYWRHFHLVGTEPFEMADHFAGPRRRTKGCPSTGSRQETWPVCWLVFGRSATRFWHGRENPIRSSSFRKPGSTGSGSAGLWWKEGIESHVVDAASIAVSPGVVAAPRLDKIDGEGLLQALLAFKQGEPRVCSMVRVPMPRGRGPPPDLSRTPDADRRADTACPIGSKVCCFLRGSRNYEPLQRDRRRARWRRAHRGRATGARWART